MQPFRKVVPKFYTTFLKSGLKQKQIVKTFFGKSNLDIFKNVHFRNPEKSFENQFFSFFL